MVIEIEQVHCHNVIPLESPNWSRPVSDVCVRLTRLTATRKQGRRSSGEKTRARRLVPASCPIVKTEAHRLAGKFIQPPRNSCDSLTGYRWARAPDKEEQSRGESSYGDPLSRKDLLAIAGECTDKVAYCH